MTENRGSMNYEHLKDKLVAHGFGYRERDFNYVRDTANKVGLELKDEEFEGFYESQLRDRDVEWIMRIMKDYDLSFTKTLIGYITY